MGSLVEGCFDYSGGRSAMKRFNICSNINNGVGLQKDAELLRDLLVDWGHSVKLIHYKQQNQVEEAPAADANIFMEVVNYDLVARKVAKENWFIPNPEWFAPWDHKNGLPDFTKILCKTHDAVRIMAKYTETSKIQYMGFESRDLYDASVPREKKFLHIAGQSRYKNTMSTVYAFAKMGLEDGPKPHLTVVGAYPDEYAFAQGATNIRTHQRITDDEMKQLMNSHIFHLMPAGYEGWGHALNEGLGVGGVVMTTDHPPMNEFEGVARNLLIPYQDTIVELAAMRARVVAVPVWNAVKQAIKMTDAQIADQGAQARAAFLKQREDFRSNFKSVVEA